MKTPAAPTQARLERDGSGAAATLQPWGNAPQRVVVEPPAGTPRSTVRAQLKARSAEQYPQGKALARVRFFDIQRGLPSPVSEGDGPVLRPATPRARGQLRSTVAAVAIAPPAAPGFKAAAALPAWRELGPTLVPHGQTYGTGAGSNPSVSGRCSGLVADRNDPRHLVLCSAGGGLWGSRDAGSTWAPLTDTLPTLVMGAIAQSPSQPNVMYAGTGDGDGSIPYGVGLLRSADSGATWEVVPATALTGIGVFDLAIDPADALRVWVASSVALHLCTGGGSTVRTAIDSPCWNVSIGAAGELLAACAKGLMRSSDGGATWARVALPGTSSTTTLARLEVRHAPSNPAIVFVAGCVGSKAMLWRRAAAGGAFTAEAVPSALDASQAWYDWHLMVAPDDPNLVYWGAIELFRGKRGAAGMAWSNISSRKNGDSIHPDQHALAFDPANPGVVYACNDGGVFRSADRGDHWQSLNPGLGITEFEFLAQLESDPAWLFGGTQDNGSLASAGALRWDQVALGDGGDCAAIDRGARSIVYHSYYGMPIERAAAIGAQAYGWADVSPKVADTYPALFYPPLEASGSLLVKAGATVWVSTDEGASWAEVDLPGSNRADPDLASALHIVSETVLLVGTTNGAFYRLTRAAGGWAQATVTALASPRRGGYVSDIATTGKTGRTVWVTVSSVGGGHVFRSTTGGTSWTDRSTGLPDIAVNAIVVDPKKARTLYAATDHGVYRTVNGGTGWQPFSNGLPNVIVGDLILHAGTRRLRAGTRGRGAWELSL